MASTLSLMHRPVPQPSAIVSRVAGAAMAVRTRVVQALCAINGHERYRHLTATRVCLRCLLCGHETPGWTLTPRSAVRGMPVAPSRVALIASRRKHA